MNGHVSVLVPARNEEATLPRTLPGVLAAASQLGCPAEVVVIAPRSSPVHAHPPVEHPLLRWVATDKPGKFDALCAGAATAHGDVFVLVDADVIVAPAAFVNLTGPLLADDADVVAGQIALLPSGHTPMHRILERWASLSMTAWDMLRRDHPEFLWALPGAIYGIQRTYWPTSLLVPLVDDASIGMQAKEAGARFTYAPHASIRTAAPSHYRHWISQKLRSRRGWARLAQLRPADVARLETTLRRHLIATSAADPTSWLMRAQDRLLRGTARAALKIGRSSPGAWTPRRADPAWLAGAANSRD